MPSNPGAGGWVLYGKQTPGTTGPRYHPPPKGPPPPQRPPKPTPPKLKPFIDPFAPLTQQQITDRATAEEQAVLGPVLQQIRDAFAQRSTAGQQAITGYTQALANTLQGVGPAIQSAYGQARAAEGGINSALAGQLGTYGQNLAAQQGQQLASINAPAVVGQTTGQTSQTAQGAANAQFAKGSAGLEMLNTQGAAGGAYGAKLPGIAALSGLAHTKEFQAQLNNQLNTQLAQAQTEAARNIQSIIVHMQDLELQKAVARQSGLTAQEKLAVTAQNNAALQQYRQQLLVWRKRNDQINAAIKRTNAQTGRQNAGTNAANAAEKARHDKASEAAARARAKAAAQKNANNPNYYIDAQGRRVPKGYQYDKQGRLVRIPTGKGSSSGLPKGLGGH